MCYTFTTQGTYLNKYRSLTYHHCVHVHPVQLEVPGLAQVLELCFGRCRATVNENRIHVIHASLNVKVSILHERHEVPQNVHFHDFRLTRREAELGDEIRVVNLGVEVTAFS